MLPSYFNWKDHLGKDWTTPAKNQYEHSLCSACCVFSCIGILESVIKIQEGNADFNPDLSEQYVLSCLPESGNCKTGCTLFVFDSILSDGPEGNNCNGIILESCFPYQGRDAYGFSNSFFTINPRPISCDCKCDEWESYLVPIENWGGIHINDTKQERSLIKELIMEKGPIASSFLYPMLPVNTSAQAGLFLRIFPFSFFYWGMVKHNPNDYFPCSKTCFPFFGHAVCIAGWKDDVSIDNGGYWICKNSWGTNWGYDGFFNLEYGSFYTLSHHDSTFGSSYKTWVEYDPESYEWPFERNGK